MGKKRGRGSGGGNRGKKGRVSWSESGAECHTSTFKVYYKTQPIMAPEELDKFIDTLATPLPTCVRINAVSPSASGLRQHLVDLQAKLTETPIVYNGETMTPPSPIKFFPNKLAWAFAPGHAALRKCPDYSSLRSFVNEQATAGNMTRQEAVSMVPPLVLDVQPHHRVLDMCAAPGSKTTQMMEMILSGDAPPTGFLIANDVNIKRAFTLLTQCKRMSTDRLLVSKHDARQFPVLVPGTRVDGTRYFPGTFDRILADVPCSGDGTLRKNVDLWSSWSPGLAINVHKTQITIAQKGILHLKPGGLMVYSTCSFNPIEDEAVVAELLRSNLGTLELVDCADKLPELVRRAGVPSWVVYGKDMSVHATMPAEESNPKTVGIQSTMFPPTPEEVAWMHLERCMRVLPHDQDTGGFFIALLRKLPTATGAGGPECPVPADVLEAKVEEERLRPATEDPSVGHKSDDVRQFFKPANASEAVVAAMQDRFGLEGFPWDMLYSRMDSSTTYFVVAKELANFCLPLRGQGMTAAKAKLEVVSTGTRVFAQTRSSDAPRLAQSGIHVVLPYITKNRIVLSPKTALAAFAAGCAKTHFAFDELNEEFTAAVADVTVGSFVIVPDLSEHPEAVPFLNQLVFCARRGTRYVNILVSKEDRGGVSGNYAYLLNLEMPVVATEPAAGAGTSSPPAPAAEGGDAAAAEEAAPVAGGATES